MKDIKISFRCGNCGEEMEIEPQYENYYWVKCKDCKISLTFHFD